MQNAFPFQKRVRLAPTVVCGRHSVRSVRGDITPAAKEISFGRSGAALPIPERKPACALIDIGRVRAMKFGTGFGMGSPEQRRPVVLIVEDEFLLRIDAADMIKAAGFEVIETANADQAIEVLEARPDITVVFTDIQMPGSMDGLKLARAVRGRWPPIKIMATSGRLNVDAIDLPEGGRFLPKPYSRAQVACVLRELTIDA